MCTGTLRRLRSTPASFSCSLTARCRSRSNSRRFNSSSFVRTLWSTKCSSRAILPDCQGKDICLVTLQSLHHLLQVPAILQVQLLPRGLISSSVGVILPDSVDKDNRDLFEQILTQLTSYQEQAAPPGEEGARQVRLIQESTSERIAAGAEAVSKGVVWGAGKLSELISYGSESLKDYVQPVAEKKEVDPKWHKTAEVARDISGKAVKVSVSQVGKATMTLGRKLAPHLQRQGTRAITHITGQKESEANSNVEGVLEVAAGAVKGASTIYMGLESAAATLATSLTDNTVKVVTHKYGENVGALTDNTLYAVEGAAIKTDLGVGRIFESFEIKITIFRY
ncbi:Protein spartin [Portunus trituberculatus]|uniref:Protein spartin n=1 Tax=Portunus trituberculatus TaxID=210409 RepID=A0A5B7CGQ7_PORTR|nr:Protein spartin [Portunus trituberculatus]